jgi:hypothetical protein
MLIKIKFCLYKFYKTIDGFWKICALKLFALFCILLIYVTEVLKIALNLQIICE